LVLALLLLWWYGLWSPRELRDIRSHRPLLLGHRGVRGSQPDNSLAAFQDAFAAGLDGIECDVQLARDHALVLVHDTDIHTADGQSIPVRKMTRHQLQQHDANVITLETLFDLAKHYPHTLLNVELKLPFEAASWRYQLWGSRQLERRVAACVQIHGLQDRVLISSFHPWTLVRMRFAAPRLRVALLCYKRLPWWLAGLLHVDAIHPHHNMLDETLFRRAKRSNLMINSWTVNDADEVQRLAALPLDGIVADDPTALKLAAQGSRPLRRSVASVQKP
jgi:glycerophosphoryl diester phosphodiesterase